MKRFGYLLATMQSLQELHLIELEDPSGWITIPLSATTPSEPPPADGDSPQDAQSSAPLCAFFLQLAVLTNHLNGRDTHVWEVHVYGPRTVEAEAILPLKMTSPEFSMYAMIK